jgi:hypothetical protein
MPREQGGIAAIGLHAIAGLAESTTVQHIAAIHRDN